MNISEVKKTEQEKQKRKKKKLPHASDDTNRGFPNSYTEGT